MNQSKLIDIISSLTRKEMKDLGKMVQSPFFNQRKDVELLYQYLWKQFPFPLQFQLEKTAAFKFVFPKESFNEKKIRYTISFLYQLIKKYLAYQEFEHDSINKQILVVQSLRKKRLENLFEKESAIANQLLENQPIRNDQFHFLNYRLHYEKYQANMTKTRGASRSFQEFSNELNNFFITQKLKQSCDALIHKTVNKEVFEQKLLPDILQHIEQNSSNQSPSIQIYFHCYKMLTNENSTEDFHEFKHLIETYYNCFPIWELQDLYVLAINYCAKKINSGADDFRRHAFEIYKEGILKNVFLDENGVFNRFHYKNIVSLGIALTEFEYVEDFIESYKDLLEKKYRESTYYLNLAILHVRQSNLQKAMLLLQKVGTDDVLNNLTARGMLLRIYYDLEEWDVLHSFLDSFQNYIYRKRGLGYHKESYLNLIKNARKLLQIDIFNQKQTAGLKKKIEGTERIAEKAWLIEKLN